MTSSLHGVDGLGYKCATTEMLKRCNDAKSELIKKSFLSSILLSATRVHEGGIDSNRC